MEDRIAIIGLACRVPGAADERQFWDNLVSKTESICEFADVDAGFLDPASAVLGGPNYVRRKGILEGVELFDAGFFGYSPREAELIDPQQRLYLECAWEALENAGCDPETYSGSIGTFAGSGINTYLLLHVLPQMRPTDLVALHAMAIANEKDFLSTRVAYKLNLRGPAITVQTACSTSLVAVHLACQSLFQGECDIALAGGVTIKVPQRVGYVYHEGGVLSPDGHCRAFDAAARGTVPGNGLGIVVLKRLQDAQSEGDRIRAVILGTAVNNDGASKVGFTAPSVDGQAAVIAEAQAIAGVSPDTVDYVEAHGTGTELGDPIEVRALDLAFRRGDKRSEGCTLGSVKSNIGHLEAAAGVVGLIKTVLSLEHRIVPPTLHCGRPNPGLAIETTPFRLASEAQAWDARPWGRRAGVSSFGIGGTNAHVVVEEAPVREPSDPTNSPSLLFLSAKTPAALERRTDDIVTYLEADRQAGLGDVAYTLQVGRKAHAYRRILVCNDGVDAAVALRRRDQPRVVDGVAPNGAAPILFLFPGAGCQYPSMGHPLYAGVRIFREAMERCAKSARRSVGCDINPFLCSPADDDCGGKHVLETELALLATEYALVQTLVAWGIRPDAMLGDNLGEYAAACIAGVVTIEEMFAIGAARARVDELSTALRAVTLRPPQVPYVSSLTGTWITDEEATSPDYWIAHAGKCAALEMAVRTLTATAGYVPVEVGPGWATGSRLLEACGASPVLPTIGRSADQSHGTLLQTVGRLCLEGVSIQWKELHRGFKRNRISLPTYPFERHRFWIDPAVPNYGPVHRKPDREWLSDEGSARLHRRPGLAGQFVAPRTALERDIARVWEETLGYAPIGVHDDFFALGGNSMLGLQLLARLRSNLPPNVALQQMGTAWTIARLAAIIEDAYAKPLEVGPIGALGKLLGRSPTILLAEGEAQPPFFCIHPAGGSALCYRDLAKHMRGSRQFYGIQAPSLFGGTEPPDIEDKAILYVEALRAIQPHGPYLIGGHSYGGNVAFAIACQLADLGEEVAMVALIDTHPPGAYRLFPLDNELRRAFPDIAAGYLGLDLPAEQSATSTATNQLDRLVRALQHVYPEIDDGWVEHFYSVWAAHLAALHRYRPRKPYPGVLTYFKARNVSPQAVFGEHGMDPGHAWASLSTQRVRLHEVEGDHFSIIRRPYVEQVAISLLRYIELANLAPAQPHRRTHQGALRVKEE